MSEITATPKTAAKAKTTDVPEGMKRVIVRRPFGVTDSHQHFGFNDFNRQIQYDEPVMLPTAFVEYLRAAQRVEFPSDTNGQPKPSYSAAYNVVDA